jgi:hypothetical protein
VDQDHVGFPVSPTTTNKRGIPNSDWTRIDRAMYDACLDHRDYRPKNPNGPGDRVSMCSEHQAFATAASIAIRRIGRTNGWRQAATTIV